jgi:3-keto steroid reductase
LQTLQSHLQRTSQQALQRIHLRPENLELTNLLSVRALSQKLLASDIPRLDAIILNAGIGGWVGIDWLLLSRKIVVDWRRATTWPTSKLGAVGLVARPQLLPVDGENSDEPPLGEVFCANVFGHYLLTHWLMPLFSACPLSSPAKVIWVGSLEAARKHYNPADHQGLRTDASYEHTKRVMDYLALTSGHPTADKYVSSYTSPETSFCVHTREKLSRPTVHVTQPGILTTTIIALHWLLQQGYLLGIYIARWLGSPWATVNPYPAAISAVWLALVSHDQLNAVERKDGGKAIKWGSAVDRLGRARVEATDVPDWGYNGSGRPFAHTWWGGPAWVGGGEIGRNHGAKDPTKEEVEDFVAEGVEVWARMEELRSEWEERLQTYEKLQSQ